MVSAENLSAAVNAVSIYLHSFADNHPNIDRISIDPSLNGVTSGTGKLTILFSFEETPVERP